MEHSKAWCSVASTCSASSRTRRFSTSSSNLRSRTWETKAEQNLQTETLFFRTYAWLSRSKGWRSGESARLPPMWPGFKSPALTPYVGWVCCWFSPLLQEVFLRVLRFSPLLKKPTFPNSNSIRNRADVWMCYLQIIIIIIIINYWFGEACFRIMHRTSAEILIVIPKAVSRGFLLLSRSVSLRSVLF